MEVNIKLLNNKFEMELFDTRSKLKNENINNANQLQGIPNWILEKYDQECNKLKDRLDDVVSKNEKLKRDFDLSVTFYRELKEKFKQLNTLYEKCKKVASCIELRTSRK